MHVRNSRIVPYSPQRHADAPWHVVRAVFDEYGFPFVEQDYDRDIREPDRFYVEPHGGFAVAELDGHVAGCVGWTDEGGGLFELHRLYVHADARRSGLGEQLIRWVIGEARRHGAAEVILFSDIHFSDAHRLYERLGFVRYRFRYAPDPWQSREWGYRLLLDRA